MLVKFTSSETGELMMFAEAAGQLLRAIGKECTARGTFTPEEMLSAAQALREAVERGEAPPSEDDELDPDEKEKPVALRHRAWPLIEMLERTAKRGAKAHVVWEAARDF